MCRMLKQILEKTSEEGFTLWKIETLIESIYPKIESKNITLFSFSPQLNANEKSGGKVSWKYSWSFRAEQSSQTKEVDDLLD